MERNGGKNIFRCKRKRKVYEENLLCLHLDRLGHFYSAFKRNETQKDRNSRNPQILGGPAICFQSLLAVSKEENGPHSSAAKALQSFENGVGRKASFGNRRCSKYGEIDGENGSEFENNANAGSRWENRWRSLQILKSLTLLDFVSYFMKINIYQFKFLTKK